MDEYSWRELARMLLESRDVCDIRDHRVYCTWCGCELLPYVRNSGEWVVPLCYNPSCPAVMVRDRLRIEGEQTA